MSAASASDRKASFDSVHPDLEEQGPSRVYLLYKDTFKRHYEIKGPDEELLFYVDISEFTPKKPELTLHAGTSTEAPVVAVSNFLKLSGNYKLGLGNPDDMNHVQWEDMTKETFHGSRYRFEMDIPGTPDRPGQRRSFLWKRTRHVAVQDDEPSKWNPHNFKLVDASTGQILAIFTGQSLSFSKRGKLQINADLGENFDTMVLISYMSLFERIRRRGKQGSAGGGGA